MVAVSVSYCGSVYGVLVVLEQGWQLVQCDCIRVRWCCDAINT